MIEQPLGAAQLPARELTADGGALWSKLLLAVEGRDLVNIPGLAREYLRTSTDTNRLIFANTLIKAVELVQPAPPSEALQRGLTEEANFRQELERTQIRKNQVQAAFEQAQRSLEQAEQEYGAVVAQPGAPLQSQAVMDRIAKMRSKTATARREGEQLELNLASLKQKLRDASRRITEEKTGISNRLANQRAELRREVARRIPQLAQSGEPGAAANLATFYSGLFGGDPELTKAVERLRGVREDLDAEKRMLGDLGKEARELMAQKRPWEATNAIAAARKRLDGLTLKDPGSRTQAQSELDHLGEQAQGAIEVAMVELNRLQSLRADEPQRVEGFTRFRVEHPDFPNAARVQGRLELEAGEAEIEAIRGEKDSRPLQAYQRLQDFSTNANFLQLEALRKSAASVSNEILQDVLSSLGQRIQATRAGLEKDQARLEAMNWSREPMNEDARRQFVLLGREDLKTQQREETRASRELERFPHPAPVSRGMPRSIWFMVLVVIMGVAAAAWVLRRRSGWSKPVVKPSEARPREAATREAAAREAATREGAPREGAPREGAPREAATREAATREAATREAAAREAAAREAAAREAAAREAAAREAAAREAAARDAATRDAATREAATREAATREAATREAATRDAATREAAREETKAQESNLPEAEPARLPNARQYARAVMTPKVSFLDEDLKMAIPETMADNPSQPLVYSGQFAKIYKLRNGSRSLAFKCWTHSIGDAADRYAQVSRWLAAIPEPYFIEFEYLPKAIRVDGRPYSGIKMEWVEGDTLREFVEGNLERPRALFEVGLAFRQVVESLHGHQIAHGDLQGGNIMVVRRNRGVGLRLIDYDNMVVPALRGKVSTHAGHSDFQHPRRIAAQTYQTSTQDDYFSELVIYTALMALACSGSARRWYRGKLNYRQGFEPLVFAESDFRDPAGSEVFAVLRAEREPYVAALTQALANACQSEIASLQRLESALARIAVPPPSPEAAPERAVTP